MAGQILVPLKRHDRIEGIIPYIEETAQPGMKVVFLIRYPVNGFVEWLQDHWLTTESTKEAMLAGRKIMERYSWNVQRGLAEQKIALARQALHKRGIEVAVDVYVGSLRRVIDDCTRYGDVHLIMIRVSNTFEIMRLLHGTPLLRDLFKRPSFSPVLLFHPGTPL